MAKVDFVAGQRGSQQTLLVASSAASASKLEVKKKIEDDVSIRMKTGTKRRAQLLGRD